MKKVRITLLVFISLLLLSGITAFPLKIEMEFLVAQKEKFPELFSLWIEQVNEALQKTPELLFYGTDWLAFGHIVIALFFIPVYFRPMQYKANLIIAMVACLCVFPLALICGPIRGIPFFHQLIDCAFGFIGFWPLLYVYQKINQLEKSTEHAIKK